MRKFLRDAGRETARLVARRAAWLVVFTAATAPLWLGHAVPTLAVR